MGFKGPLVRTQETSIEIKFEMYSLSVSSDPLPPKSLNIKWITPNEVGTSRISQKNIGICLVDFWLSRIYV